MAKKLTEDQKTERKLLATLADLGGQRVSTQQLRRQGREFIIPETMDPQGAIEYLNDYIEQQEEPTNFSRTFRYRPWDGAHAMQAAFLKVFGTTGNQQAMMTFFGKRPPERRTIKIGPNNETEQVPWGSLSVPLFQGTIHTSATEDPEFGLLFQLIVEAPRKFQPHVEGLFQIIEDELRNGSIYKGKAIDGQSDAEFLDLSGVDSSKVIYSDDVIQQLAANIWALLDHTQVHRDLRLPLKRSVLLEGPYGTGKTLAAFLTAQRAVENGWTFVYCRPGKDDLDTVMATARLYQPSVVFFEDIDTVGGRGDSETVSRLLDLFDGITAKDTELVAVLTTNHVERIHKGMVRPGRLDAVVHIGALDAEGIEKLVRATVPEELLGEVDFAQVAEAMEDYLPAFVKEAVDRAMRYAITRTGGIPRTLVTDDFVLAADGLRDQLKLMTEAGEGEKPDSLSQAVVRAVEEGVDGARATRGGEELFQLTKGNGVALKATPQD